MVFDIFYLNKQEATNAKLEFHSEMGCEANYLPGTHPRAKSKIMKPL